MPSTFPFIFPDPPTPAARQDMTSLFKRVSFYGYHQWQIFEPLQLIGGLAYDRITFPGKFPQRARFRKRKNGGSIFPQGRDSSGRRWKTPPPVLPTRAPCPARAWIKATNWNLRKWRVSFKIIAASFPNPSRARMPGPDLRPTTFPSNKNSAPELIWAFPARY